VFRPRRRKEHGVACPRPGGEPLHKMAALSVASRLLPGMTQRDVFAHRLYSVAGIQRPVELPHVETVPGAACC
jgi:hypothetical protein